MPSFASVNTRGLVTRSSTMSSARQEQDKDHPLLTNQQDLDGDLSPINLLEALSHVHKESHGALSVLASQLHLSADAIQRRAEDHMLTSVRANHATWSYGQLLQRFLDIHEVQTRLAIDVSCETIGSQVRKATAEQTEMKLKIHRARGAVLELLKMTDVDQLFHDAGVTPVNSVNASARERTSHWHVDTDTHRRPRTQPGLVCNGRALQPGSVIQYNVNDTNRQALETHRDHHAEPESNDTNACPSPPSLVRSDAVRDSSDESSSSESDLPHTTVTLDSFDVDSEYEPANDILKYFRPVSKQQSRNRKRTRSTVADQDHERLSKWHRASGRSSLTRSCGVESKIVADAAQRIGDIRTRLTVRQEMKVKQRRENRLSGCE